ncbi:hypothetical protein F5883DRAFT_503515 [Diaporthe sp. PMI_573]|nr:hypothetical protein F5883DRAFT_503515 [Diaporthaceae sp. PMI_573]
MPTIPPQDKQQIAGCNAMLIRRGGMRESFWTNMEEPTQETSDLAFDLFDRYGRLNPEFYEHDINKGTGVWGKELDHGDILLFDVLRVDAAYRRRGIGAKLVNAILEKTREMVSERVGFFALTRSGFLWSEMSHLKKDSAEMEKAQDDAENGALGFWHAMGFRRVGTSSWLAWTDSPGHPSRQLAISQDWRSPDDLTADIPLPDEMKQAFQKLADPAVKAAECVDELTKTLPKDFEAGQWQTIDQDGNTLLHIASLSCKPEVTSFLLSKAPRLTTVRNKRGHTALEALQNQLEGLRTRRSVRLATLVTSDAFKGFSDSSIACLAALKHTAIFDLSNIKQTLRYKYGCTCGQCIGGFLSPRMKFALLCVAEIQHGNMELSIDETGPGWVSFHGDLLTHLPRSVRENLNTNRSMRKGFANMFSHFAQCLHLGRIPTEAEVLDFHQFDAGEWPPVTRNYLQRGGSVTAVANAIFERAMEQDEWAGDGAHRGIFWEDIDALVACRNDHEFGFVAGVCGYKRVRPSSSRFVDLSGRELDLD